LIKLYPKNGQIVLGSSAKQSVTSVITNHPDPPMTIDHSMTQRALDQLLEHIARQHLSIETLQTQRSDQLDFHDVSVWSVKSALQAAFEAGKQAERAEVAKDQGVQK
jgi:hypothetical protein